jgi:hypothetical protein
MRGIIFILFITLFCSTFAAESQQPSISPGMATSSSSKRTRATADVTVKHSEVKPYDESAKPVLKELFLSETFSGEIEGDSDVRALQVAGEGGTTTMISLQRFRGSVGGKRGTFVLQGKQTIERGRIEATWFVVPGSGTDELAGLRGEGGFNGQFGKGSKGYLDYWFE